MDGCVDGMDQIEDGQARELFGLMEKGAFFEAPIWKFRKKSEKIYQK